MMPGVEPPSLDGLCSAEAADEAVDPELLLDLNQQPFLSSSSPLQEKKPWSQDGDVLRRGLRDSQWELWLDFMEQHGRLDAWLRLAEQAVASPHRHQVTYGAAKEELRRMERLRCEAAAQLLQLDSLTRRTRALSLLQGPLRARLLEATRQCGRRWDGVKATLKTASGRLQRFVSEWEEFGAEREELMLWLADMDARLSDIDHMAGNNREKLRRLQSFQKSVCENSGRVNELLERGEELIQRCEPADAQTVERRLLELLRRCSHVYNNVARTHTRLLSMRLVFEEDWILSRASDSGCPSESVHEDGVFERNHLDLASPSALLTEVRPSVGPAPTRLPRRPSPPPSSPSSPTHEHLGLEWDPSVDIGRSVSHDDADSSYFSACTGLCHREETKRMSYLGSFDSRSDISADITADITNQEAALEWTDPTEPAQGDDQWTASAPEGDVDEPMRFDGGRVTAWVQSSAPTEDATSCSRAVQTDGDVQRRGDGFYADALNQRRLPLKERPPLPLPLPEPSGPSWDPEGEAGHLPSPVQDEDELPSCEEAELPLSEGSSRASSSSALLFLLLAAALALLASLVWLAWEPPSFHLTLDYVNGPPPT